MPYTPSKCSPLLFRPISCAFAASISAVAKLPSRSPASPHRGWRSIAPADAAHLPQFGHRGDRTVDAGPFTELRRNVRIEAKGLVFKSHHGCRGKARSTHRVQIRAQSSLGDPTCRGTRCRLTSRWKSDTRSSSRRASSVARFSNRALALRSPRRTCARARSVRMRHRRRSSSGAIADSASVSSAIEWSGGSPQGTG